MMVKARDKAREVLAEWAVPEVLATADRLESKGKVEWLFDPVVENVIGLVKSGTNTALVIVYLADSEDRFVDFETSGEFDELMSQKDEDDEMDARRAQEQEDLDRANERWPR